MKVHHNFKTERIKKVIKTVALTDEEYTDLLALQTDPTKSAMMQRVAQTPRRSGDKLYMPQWLIDGLRTPVVREENVREVKR
jgi:hypothetical protein